MLLVFSTFRILREKKLACFIFILYRWNNSTAADSRCTLLLYTIHVLTIFFLFCFTKCRIFPTVILVIAICNSQSIPRWFKVLARPLYICDVIKNGHTRMVLLTTRQCALYALIRSALSPHKFDIHRLFKWQLNARGKKQKNTFFYHFFSSYPCWLSN